MCAVLKMILPFLFSVLFARENERERASDWSSTGSFHETVADARKNIKLHASIFVVCLSTMTVFHTIEYRKRGWWSV